MTDDPVATADDPNLVIVTEFRVADDLTAAADDLNSVTVTELVVTDVAYAVSVTT
ncbi:hypothetical protein [Leptolyngbya sp. FACHB-261]|uniref:hypothetical protein n=1 Tax=Leptolyngbya sp. FACHB-261 TaxID=2692806 RepID=UPI0016875954|nr:hypothetical protein [Leptolyngbya sp. FACHB-261]